MKSAKCPKCSLVQWSDDTCKRCGASLATDFVPRQYAAPGNYDPQPYQQQSFTGGGQLANQQLKQGLAVASMVVGIISFPTTFLLIGLILAPVALVMGIVALVRATKKPTEYGGKGFAIAGISVASVVCVFFVPLIAAIAIPNLLASRRAANEASAISTLKRIALAQNSHSSIDPAGACGDLSTLAMKNLIPASLASGRKNGYKFAAGGSQSDEAGCEVRATPESLSDGNRSFYFSSTDEVIHVALRGRPAQRTDPSIDDEVVSARQR